MRRANEGEGRGSTGRGGRGRPMGRRGGAALGPAARPRGAQQPCGHRARPGPAAARAPGGCGCYAASHGLHRVSGGAPPFRPRGRHGDTPTAAATGNRSLTSALRGWAGQEPGQGTGRIPWMGWDLCDRSQGGTRSPLPPAAGYRPLPLRGVEACPSAVAPDTPPLPSRTLRPLRALLSRPVRVPLAPPRFPWRAPAGQTGPVVHRTPARGGAGTGTGLRTELRWVGAPH